MDKQEKTVGTIDETLELMLEETAETDQKITKHTKAAIRAEAEYSNKIHRFNKDTGLYDEFDNTLQKTEDGLETVNGLCRVRFPGDSSSKAVSMSCEDGKYTVSWEYLASNPRKTIEGRTAKKLPAPELSKRSVKQ